MVCNVLFNDVAFILSFFFYYHYSFWISFLSRWRFVKRYSLKKKITDITIIIPPCRLITPFRRCNCTTHNTRRRWCTVHRNWSIRIRYIGLLSKITISVRETGKSFSFFTKTKLIIDTIGVHVLSERGDNSFVMNNTVDVSTWRELPRTYRLINVLHQSPN